MAPIPALWHNAGMGTGVTDHRDNDATAETDGDKPQPPEAVTPARQAWRRLHMGIPRAALNRG